MATTGTDGYLNIYEIQEDQSSVSLLSKIKICEKAVKADRAFEFGVQWLQGTAQGQETIIVSGNTCIGAVQRGEEDGTEWALSLEERVAHDNVISSLFAISEEVLVTHSYDDSLIRIWRINEEGFSCLSEIKLKKPAISMEYDNRTKCLAVMDVDHQIGIFKRDFSGGASEDKS